MVNPRAVPPSTTMMTSERTTPTTEANSVEGACTAEKSLVHLLLWRLEQLSPTLCYPQACQQLQCGQEGKPRQQLLNVRRLVCKYFVLRKHRLMSCLLLRQEYWICGTL